MEILNEEKERKRKLTALECGEADGGEDGDGDMLMG